MVPFSVVQSVTSSWLIARDNFTILFKLFFYYKIKYVIVNETNIHQTKVQGCIKLRVISVFNNVQNVCRIISYKTLLRLIIIQAVGSNYPGTSLAKCIICMRINSRALCCPFWSLQIKPEIVIIYK